MIGSFNDELSNREREKYQQERQMFELQSEHQIRIKQLEIEQRKLEAKWTSWLSLPKTIIMLPVLVVMGIAYCIAITRKQEPSQSFWDFMR